MPTSGRRTGRTELFMRGLRLARRIGSRDVRARPVGGAGPTRRHPDTELASPAPA
jgi:hypothetical protein